MSKTTLSPKTKQRQSKTRTCRLAHTDGGPALVIHQREGKQAIQVDCYFLSEIGADQGRGFQLVKHDGTRYAVNVLGEHESCECPGHLQHGHKTVCKHRGALRKLIAEGKLPAPAPVPVPPVCLECSGSGHSHAGDLTDDLCRACGGEGS